MTIRTTEQTVSFRQPFALKSSERVYPAGFYRIVTDEEPIEGLSFLAYRRVSTMMFVPAARGNGSVEMIVIDPIEFEAARLREMASGDPDTSTNLYAQESTHAQIQHRPGGRSHSDNAPARGDRRL
jgi:hypothetical protein